MKVILITGATNGIGLETAKLLATQGHIVYAAGRNLEKLESLNNIKSLYLDITDEKSIESAVNKVISEQDRIDVLINNAGYGSYGSIEDVSLTEARNQFDVNVFGLASLTQKIIPVMRKQNDGHIINISSIYGRFTASFGGWYHATKYAVEALNDTLRLETKQYGIEVTVIEPGPIKTDWGIIAANKLADSAQGSAYEKQALKSSNRMKKLYTSNLLSKPQVVSKAIANVVNKKQPKVRYVVGRGAKFFIFLNTIIPTRIFDKIISKI
ncbi:oxidoreductase [Mammaliicoccus sp. Dog046]|uniref:oxidoreductase n=1 Tax=Mammaliicoccus sp. Dog046 TaxID=3034233 RepID=UPI002B25A5B0|nr:oxidoreductase [Mammaliicoccus sp. Dog046]WQK84807.1 oxidoreductase [Mammaliicoccus sp. Dog046]